MKRKEKITHTNASNYNFWLNLVRNSNCNTCKTVPASYDKISDGNLERNKQT